MLKKCSKCGIEKSAQDFNRDKNRKDGLQRYCKPCRNQAKREYHLKQVEKGWDVYILPEENYAGLSSYAVKRISNHRDNGMNTDGWYIYSTHKTPEEAIIAEATLHLKGFRGCKYRKEENVIKK